MKPRYFGSIRRTALDWKEVEAGFTQAERESNVKAFLDSPENLKLWERLEETEQRLPWCRNLIKNLRAYVEYKGKMSDKQKSLATSLYLDCCMTTDDKLEEQTNCRKLGYRLMELQLGRTNDFVRDVMLRCDGRAFTGGQMRAMYNIAKRVAHPLANIPELTDENFDGWFKVENSQNLGLDTENGLC